MAAIQQENLRVVLESGKYIFVWHMHFMWGSSCIWVNMVHFFAKNLRTYFTCTDGTDNV